LEGTDRSEVLPISPFAQKVKTDVGPHVLCQRANVPNQLKRDAEAFADVRRARSKTIATR